MKLKWLVAASLCLNLALCVLWFSGQSDAPASAPAASAAKPKVVIRTETERIEDKVNVAGAVTIQKDSWRHVEAKELKTLVANLRAAHCPDETIRDIVLARINRHFAGRWKAIMMPEPLKFWEPWDATVEAKNPKLIEERIALEREREEMVRDALGLSYDRELRKYDMSWTALDQENRLLEFLPEAKRRAIQDQTEKTRRLTAEITNRMQSGPGLPSSTSPEDAKELAKIQRESREAIRALLTPEEYWEYAVRASPFATGLRSELVGFNPTQKEYEAIFWADEKAREAVVGYVPGQPFDSALVEQHARASGEKANELRNALGEQRYYEYQRNSDYAYRDMLSVAREENLSPDLAAKVYEMKVASEAEANRIRGIKGNSMEERFSSLEALQRQTQQNVRQVLGDSAYNRYHTRGGYWLRTLSR